MVDVTVTLDTVPRIEFWADHEVTSQDIDEAVMGMGAKAKEIGIPLPFEFWIGQEGVFGKTMRCNRYAREGSE